MAVVYLAFQSVFLRSQRDLENLESLVRPTDP